MTILNATCFDATTEAQATGDYPNGHYNGAGINDWYITNLNSGLLPDIATNYGYNGMILSIESALQLWKGEYVFDITQGISYNYMLSNPYVQNGYVVTQIYNAIMNCNNYLNSIQLNAYGIKDVQNITFTVTKQRAATINAVVYFYGSNPSILITI